MLAAVVVSNPEIGEVEARIAACDVDPWVVAELRVEVELEACQPLLVEAEVDEHGSAFFGVVTDTQTEDMGLGGLEVHVAGNRATLADGTIAGSVTSLYKCLLTAVSMGIPLESAVKAATINPCRSIGIDQKYGSISKGKKAHFLVLDQKDLSIKAVIKGSTCYTHQKKI